MKDKKPTFNYYDGFIIAYVILNGFAVGNTIKTTTHMINNGYDNTTMICLLLWLGITAHTARRIYQTERDKKNNENNQKQR